MCQITLNTIQGQSINGVNATSFTLSGTAASACQKVRLELSGCNYNSHIAVVPVTNGTWQYQLSGECLCDHNIKVEATCCDAAGNPVPGCAPVSFDKPIVCSPPNCCLNVQITPTVGDCNANNQRLVTFNVTVTAAPNQSACQFPYVVELKFGDGSSSGAQVIASVGSHSFSATHYYNANASYVAQLHYVLPGGLACPVAQVALNIESCSPNCCPRIIDVDVNIGDCNASCERLVTLTTSFAPPVGSCPPAYLEWQITDKNNHSTSGNGFPTDDPSPHTEQFWLTSANSPYTARLLVHYPHGCDEIVRTISVPECQSGVPCPEINNFSHSVGGCVPEGERCCREVSFSFDAFALLGCGGGPKPKVRLNFGDGTYNDLEFGTSGPQRATFTNRYCEEGDYVVTLETLYPAGCPDRTLVVQVPKCEPSECETVEPPSSKFCPCCIGLLILVTSYFFLWTQGYYQGDLVIYTVALGSKFGYASFLFTLLLWLLITFCYKKVKACKECWLCRFYKCMFYALLVSIVMIIVMVVIAYYYGNMAAVPEWLPAILSAIVSAIGFYSLMKTEPCKTFYATGKCK